MFFIASSDDSGRRPPEPSERNQENIDPTNKAVANTELPSIPGADLDNTVSFLSGSATKFQTPKSSMLVTDVRGL